jgi:hypothetical protein
MLFRSMQELTGANLKKLCGTGLGGDFRLTPDLRRWVTFLSWKTPAERQSLVESKHLKLVQSISSRYAVLDLEPLEGRGMWDKADPFTYTGRPMPSPVAVLTRASIFPRKTIDFWRNVPATRVATQDAEGLLFKVGFGELPVVRQATFSVWNSPEALRAFAYKRPEHRLVIERARERGWYSEELFARFAIIGRSGTWELPPELAVCQQA